MEKIEKILAFISGSGDGYGYGNGDGYGYGDGDGSGDGSGNGYGNGDGDGDGYGDGSGYGYGNGDGDGYGDGSGYGYGNGDGDGDGYGYGNGDGDGYGDGSGYGYGDGSKITKAHGDLVFYVDNVPTIFDHIHGNAARGKIVNESDYSLKPCYIVKGNGYFAHEDTIEKAMQTLQEKIYANMDIDERIKEFREKFNNTDKYTVEEFFSWHHILTGSCLIGRNNFIKKHNYNLQDSYTVKEFVEACENDYGGQVIKKLKKYYI